MEIIIVGGGPAGTWASVLLARGGHTVTLIDSQGPWEKPCGGGVTTKALERFGIFETDLPRKYIDRITIFFGDTDSVSVLPQKPLAVLSRREMGKHLFNEAVRAGVRIIQDRVTGIQPDGARWAIRTRKSLLQAEYLIGADGTTSLVRRSVGHALPPEDL